MSDGRYDWITREIVKRAVIVWAVIGLSWFVTHLLLNVVGPGVGDRRGRRPGRGRRRRGCVAVPDRGLQPARCPLAGPQTGDPLVTLPRFLRRLFRLPGSHSDLDAQDRDQSYRRGWSDGVMAEKAGGVAASPRVRDTTTRGER